MKLSGIWNQALLLWPLVFKRVWPWVLFTLFIDICSNFMTNFIRQLDERFIISAAGLAISIQLVVSAFSMIIINQVTFDVKNRIDSNIFKALSANLKYIIIETTRALLPILLKILLFIVPGIIEAVRLYFVPFVVQFDSKYKTGQIDALKQSRALVQGNLMKVMGILILTMLLSIVPRLCLHSVTRLETAFLFSAALFMCLVLETYSFIVMYCVYEKLTHASKETNGHSISLSGASQS